MPRSCSVAILLIVALLSSIAHAADEQDPKQPAIAKFDIDWLELPAALERALADQRPLCVVWPGAPAEEFWKKFAAEYEASNAFKDVAKKFLFARIGDTKDEGADRFGHLEDTSAIFLLDFMGNLLFRFSGEVPKASSAARQMQIVAKRNGELIEPYRKVDELAKKTLYAIELKEHRKAVGFLLEAEKIALPTDSAPARARTAARRAIEKLIDDKLAEAELLEGEKKYDQALAIYRQLRRDLPLPERVPEIDERITAVKDYTGD